MSTLNSFNDVFTSIINNERSSDNIKKHVSISQASASSSAFEAIEKYVVSFDECARDKYALRKYAILASMLDKKEKSSARDSFHNVAEVIAHYAQKSESLVNRKIFINAQHKTRRQADMLFKVLENLNACERKSSHETRDLDELKLKNNNRFVNAILKFYTVS